MFTAQQLPILAAALLPLPVTVTNWSPSDLLASWSEDGTNITIPIASWPGLTASLADAITGDARQVVVGFCQAAYDWHSGLSSPPDTLEVKYVPIKIQTSGEYAGKLKAKWEITAYMDYSSSGVVTEEI